MSRKAIIMDLLTFEQVYHHSITEISAVAGSDDVYGWAPAYIIAVNNATTGFSDRVIRGSDQSAEGYQAYANYITPDGTVNSWSLQARGAIAKDRYAMLYVSPASMGPELKELAIQPYEGGPYVPRTLESIHDPSYPLTNQYYFHLSKTPGQPLDAKVDEFMHFILSQESQDYVQREGRYSPLTAGVVRAQLRKLEVNPQ